MSLPAIIAAWLLSIIAALGCGWKLGLDHVEAREARKTGAAAQQTAQAAISAASAIADTGARNAPIKQTIITRVIEKPVFHECRTGPDAVRLLNSIATGDAPASDAAGSGDVPSSGPAQ